MCNMEIRSTSSKGRGLYATSNIKAGTVLFEEAPLVSCQFSWNAAYGYASCEYCLKPLETAEQNVRRLTNDSTINLPFPECCLIYEQLDKHAKCPACLETYCSNECLENAFKLYHQTLCLGSDKNNTKHPINILVDYWKQMHYPPETASIMLVIKIIGMFKQCGNVDELQKTFGDFVNEVVNKDLMIFHKMLGENYTEQVDRLYELICSAFNPSNDDCLRWIDFIGFRSMLALIGTNGQGIGTSSFADWVRRVSELDLAETQRESVDLLIDNLYNKLDEVVGSFLNNEGSALYIRQSKINHSCSPNAECRFPHSNNVLVLTATRDIKAEEEICISYLDECALERSRHSRQKMLSENYLFHCQCLKCESQVDDPDITSEEDDSDEENMDRDSD